MESNTKTTIVKQDDNFPSEEEIYIYVEVKEGAVVSIRSDSDALKIRVIDRDLEEVDELIAAENEAVDEEVRALSDINDGLYEYIDLNEDVITDEEMEQANAELENEDPLAPEETDQEYLPELTGNI